MANNNNDNNDNDNHRKRKLAIIIAVLIRQTTTILAVALAAKEAQSESETKRAKQGRYVEGLTQIAAAKSVAEHSHHSSGTHASMYATMVLGGVEEPFAMFHSAIGEASQERVNTPDFPKALTEQELEHAVKQVVGVDAKFLLKEQAELVWHSANTEKKHVFCGIPCDSGKSMAWILRLVAYRLKG